MKVLGISCYYHDSAATILIDNEIVAAVQEERFTRIKHTPDFPSNSIKFCLEETGLKIEELDAVVFYDKPIVKFERLLSTFYQVAPKGLIPFIKSIPIWLKEKLFLRKLIYDNLKEIEPSLKKKDLNLLFTEHHISHAASSFYPSNFKESAILTIDGVGEWSTASICKGEDKKIEILKELHFPHSVGLLYSAFTYYLGFRVNSGEYKLMGLAPYGTPIYTDKIINNLIDIKEDGTFRLDQKYFNYTTGLTMTNKKFDSLFNQSRRDPAKQEITQFHMDIAASIQKVTEDIMIKLARSLKDEYKIDNLCLAGGVALNCVANGKILKEKIFNNIWVQPASGDAGGSLGATLALWHIEQKNPRQVNPNDSMQGSYLGPEYSQEEIIDELKKIGANFEILSENDLIEQTAIDLSEGKAIGWFQGRMEFGPRALGARSILGDPRTSEMQKTLNLKVKYRESFRPFAPSVLREDASEWFEIDDESPYMLLVSNINSKKTYNMSEKEKALFGIDKLNIKRSEIPAVTHVDYTARIQTVKKEVNQKYYNLIKRFKEKTNVPVVVNTSFNVRGEPIVNTPYDAFNCFMGTELDNLAIGNCYLKKIDQNKQLKKNYQNEFELD